MFDYRMFFAILVILAAAALVPAAILSSKQEFVHPMRRDLYGNTEWVEPKEL